MYRGPGYEANVKEWLNRMYLLTKFTYKECLYWLTKCTNKNHTVNGYVYVSHNHSYISSSDMADATIFYYYLCRDGCVKHSHLQCGSCCDSRNTRGEPDCDNSWITWQFQIKNQEKSVRWGHFLHNDLISNCSGVRRASFMHSLRPLTNSGRQ